LYSKGLNLALDNFLNGRGLDLELQVWFDFEIPKTTLPQYLIKKFL
jgi:hypothetical protein